jgi:hypothetical protein
MFAVIIGIGIMNGTSYNQGYEQGSIKGMELYHEFIMKKLEEAPIPSIKTDDTEND